MAKKLPKKKRREGPVSIWVGVNRPAAGVDILEDLCGVEYYSLDNQEVIVDNKAWRLQSVEDLLRRLSYSKSFVSEAVRAAKTKGFQSVLYVVCQYDMDYTNEEIQGEVATDPAFLGVFRWNDDE